MIYEVIDYKNENPAVFTWMKRYEKSEDEDIWVKCEVDMSAGPVESWCLEDETPSLLGCSRVMSHSLVSFKDVFSDKSKQVNEPKRLDSGELVIMNKFTVFCFLHDD